MFGGQLAIKVVLSADRSSNCTASCAPSEGGKFAENRLDNITMRCPKMVRIAAQKESFAERSLGPQKDSPKQAIRTIASFF